MRRKGKFLIVCVLSVMAFCGCNKGQEESSVPTSEVSKVEKEDQVDSKATDGNQAEEKPEVTIQATIAVEDNDTIEETDFQADAKGLIAALEETHPAFILDDVPKAYDEAKESYLEESASPDLTKIEFGMLTRKFLTTLGDGHTHPWYVRPFNYVKLNVMAMEDELWILDESKKKTNEKITEIGGKKTSEIFQVIDTYYAAENDSAKNANHAVCIVNQPLLACAGCEFDDQGIDIVIEGESGSRTENLAWISTDEPVQEEQTTPVANMESKIINDDILYVDWNSCELEDTEFYSNVNVLTSALREGVTKVILDMRDNGGGNAYYCRSYLDKLGMQGPEYGVVFRHSPLAAEQRGETETTGMTCYDANPFCVINKKIQLVILVNEDTFSAATMLGVYVQDGKLGTVIGHVSENSPTCYSDVIYYEMENSGLKVQMSTSYLTRPDSEADQKSLVPDIETALEEDSLERAVEYLESGK